MNHIGPDVSGARSAKTAAGGSILHCAVGRGCEDITCRKLASGVELEVIEAHQNARFPAETTGIIHDSATVHCTSACKLLLLYVDPNTVIAM